MNTVTNKIKKRYNRISGLYDIMEAPMEHGFSKWRKRLLKKVKGKTLEVGIGTGKNIPYYPERVELTAIDFSEKMIEKAGKKAKDKPNISLYVMDIENMDFENNTFDTVVSSCVFCSVPDPIRGLKEIGRVCKNKGKILMLEHVRSNKRITGKIMDILNPIPVNTYGANINRKTHENIIKAGFNPDNIHVDYLWKDIVLLIEIKNEKNNKQFNHG